MSPKKKVINCLRSDIQLQPMLLGGQSFRWSSPEKDTYTGVFQERVWILKQTDTGIDYECYPETKDAATRLKSYLRIDTDLKKLYKTWSIDPHFKKAAEKFHAVRMLHQEVAENVFSFICSSNNNITRISSMVEKLCKMYGKSIGTVNGVEYFGFPAVASLSDPKVDAELRKAGFGYRAKFIHQTACRIEEAGEVKWREHLTSLDYSQAKEELTSLPGIGPKVADCICLMSLGHLEAIPVDTHVFQIASTHYLKHLKDKKSVTDKMYNEIGDHFRTLFGPYAGWAHTILFCADLKTFKGTGKKRKATE